jgi:hypothetical protein
MRSGVLRAITIGGIAVVGVAGCSSGAGKKAAAPHPSVSPSVSASVSVGRPTVTGPITGGTHGFPFTATPVDLASQGYLEQEFFLQGRANSYVKVGTWTSNGRWKTARGSSAPYTTRILVRRPTDPKKFNGTVIVEWLNVSSNIDVDPDFGYESRELLREGFAWVGVSAQAAGITSRGGSSLGPKAVGLKAWDPRRYAALEHPGDDYSYDIFSQAGEALLAARGDNPLGDLKVRHLIADGESQSAFRMLTYVNAVAPVAGVYDGFLIHSRAGGGAPISSAASGQVPAPARVRTDLKTPVLQVETETDMFVLAGLVGGSGQTFPSARQPDTSRVRTWEVAGTAHADATYLGYLSEQGRHEVPNFLDLSGVLPIVNNGPESYVMNAAVHALNQWVASGTLPPRAEPLETANGKIVRDKHGNALGGVRTPQLDVPTATLTGEGAQLTGKTIPFDAATLAALYPTHAAYVSAFDKATDDAVRAGFVLPADAQIMKTKAAATNVG